MWHNADWLALNSHLSSTGIYVVKKSKAEYGDKHAAPDRVLNREICPRLMNESNGNNAEQLLW